MAGLDRPAVGGLELVEEGVVGVARATSRCRPRTSASRGSPSRIAARASGAGSRGTRCSKRSTSSVGTLSRRPVVPSPERDGHLLDRVRRVLRLLEQRHQALAAVELLARRRVEVGGEHRERLHRAELRQVDLERAGDRLHRLGHRRATHAGHRDADVDRRALVGVEQVGLQEDLAVGDRDDVGRDVGRHVVGLGLDDRQTGHRARAHLVGELRAALEQPAVQVEDVAGVGLAARRAAQQQRHGAVGLGLLGQVVEDDQDVLAVVHPVLADGRAGVGREVLEAGACRTPGRRRSWCTPARRPPRGRRAPRRWSSPSGRWRRRCSGPACPGRRTPSSASG